MEKQVFLPFEKELEETASKIEALEAIDLEKGTNSRTEIRRLEKELARRTAEIYSELTPWQTALVARHPNRPYTLDYIERIFEDFHELHGDRTFADDQSIVGGLARLAEHAVMVIGHQKGRDTRERTRRNFGMTRPEGYRKALRLMKLAEKFNLPVFTFIDTPGAYPGIDAEERNQSEAIGRNILELTKLRVPVIATIIGEGGSGGALAIAVADSVLMLQYATYSVISPEGCASILWKSAEKAGDAAKALGLTAERLMELKLIDKVISEPIGGAHRDYKLMASTLRKALVDQLKAAKSLTTEELLQRRLERIISYGRFETTEPTALERFTAPENVADPVAEVKAEVQNPQEVIEGSANVKPEAVQAENKPRARRTRKSAPKGALEETAPVKRVRKSPAKTSSKKAESLSTEPADAEQAALLEEDAKVAKS